MHSSFKVRILYVIDLGYLLTTCPAQAISQADYVVPVEIEYHWHNVYVIKRPGVDNFLKKMGEIYEVVVFTASLSKVRFLLPLPPTVIKEANLDIMTVRRSRVGQA